MRTTTSWVPPPRRTSTFKLKMSALYPDVTSTDLLNLAAVVKAYKMHVGLEIGGARWGRGRCDAASQLAFAKKEQAQVRR